MLEGTPPDDNSWQLGPQAIPDDVLAPYEASAYSILDTLGIPRNLSDSDLGEACGPLTWSCIATAGKCVLDRITPVIDGHLSPAPSACLCFPSGMTPTEVTVAGEDMALGCSFVCMEALHSAVNEYLRARNGRKGQQLDCIKVNARASTRTHALSAQRACRAQRARKPRPAHHLRENGCGGGCGSTAARARARHSCGDHRLLGVVRGGARR